MVECKVSSDLVEMVDAERMHFFARLDTGRRTEMGQFGTPPSVARLMASMFGPTPRAVRILDAGAGVGSLTAALVAELLGRADRPESIHVTAVEAEEAILPGLRATLKRCRDHSDALAVGFSHEVVADDFIEYIARSEADLFGARVPLFNCAIQNPPYRKIRSDSRHRALLRGVGIEVSNLYAAFIALTVRMLEPGGQ